MACLQQRHSEHYVSWLCMANEKTVLAAPPRHYIMHLVLVYTQEGTSFRPSFSNDADSVLVLSPRLRVYLSKECPYLE